MEICLFLFVSLSPFFVLAMLSYGISPMGSMGSHVPAVWDLWDLYRSMGLRCGTYGVIYGDLWDDLWGPQVLTRLRSHSYGVTVPDLWGPQVFTRLRSHTYGVSVLLWGCGARPMGN